MSQQTVTINGTVYDAHTGLPLDTKTQAAVSSDAQSRSHSSQSIHHTTQKSQTLNRHVVQKKSPSPSIASPRASTQKSPMITKYAPRPVMTKSSVRPISDIGPMPHALLNKTQQSSKAQSTTMAQAPAKPSQVIKQEAINEAMQKAPHHNRNEKLVKRTSKLKRFASVSSVGLAMLLLGGYFTYLNMPSLSVRVAAASAGVNATYPEYRPDGYSLSGAVAYSEGQVNMKFASNSGDQNFIIDQKKSNWDSSAVLENYVTPKAGGNYITYNERGLTIYTFGSNAAWINDGILYTINGNAPLSSDQIRRIATSL